MNLKSLFFITLTTFSVNLNAAIIDNGNFISDTETNLDFLKMSFSDGKSFNQIQNLINTDSDYLGYQFASQNQVIDLFNNFYGSNVLNSNLLNLNVLDFNKTYNFINLLGSTDSSFTGGSNAINNYWLRGLIDGVNVSGNHFWIDFLSQDFSQTNDLAEYTFSQTPGISSSSFNVNRGAFLVKSSVSPVSESSTFAMFALGLLGLIGINYRRQKFI